jgi:hypothetical protein
MLLAGGSVQLSRAPSCKQQRHPDPQLAVTVCHIIASIIAWMHSVLTVHSCKQACALAVVHRRLWVSFSQPNSSQPNRVMYLACLVSACSRSLYDSTCIEPVVRNRLYTNRQGSITFSPSHVHCCHHKRTAQQPTLHCCGASLLLLQPNAASSSHQRDASNGSQWLRSFADKYISRGLNHSLVVGTAQQYSASDCGLNHLMTPRCPQTSVTVNAMAAPCRGQWAEVNCAD